MVLLYDILFVQQLWVAAASKDALLNIHYYYYYYSMSAMQTIQWFNMFHLQHYLAPKTKPVTLKCNLNVLQNAPVKITSIQPLNLTEKTDDDDDASNITPKKKLSTHLTCGLLYICAPTYMFLLYLYALTSIRSARKTDNNLKEITICSSIPRHWNNSFSLQETFINNQFRYYLYWKTTG